MRDYFWRRTTLLAVALLATAGVARGAIPAADRDLVKQVSQRLLAVADRPSGMEWPPTFQIIDDKQINAFAFVSSKETEGETKLLPQVRIYEGMMEKVIEGDEDRLALILGHELNHILLGHCTKRAPGTEFVKQVFSREHEVAADCKGAELAVKAGYSLRKGVKGIQRMMAMGLDYSSFEGLGVDHPAWKDRLSYFDKEQATLWRAMSAFDNGTYLLLCEQYVGAERCFREVTKEFPACPEAWTNLGYALLMQYCDALEPEDVRRFNVGQIVVGGFYRRPQSLETQVRGINEEVWWDAVGALRESLRLQPDQVLPRANLGVAYLVRPAGKDVGQARRYLDEAAATAMKDTTLPAMLRATILVNAGVADLAGGEPEQSSGRLQQAETIGRGFAGPHARHPGSPALAASLAYNRGLLLEKSSEPDQRREAFGQFERYLRTASPAAEWWALAHEHYRKLGMELGLKAKTEKDLTSEAGLGLRLVSSLTLESGAVLSLTQPVTEVEKILGKAEPVPVMKNTHLFRLHYPDRGIDVLATDRVLAIYLAGPRAPGLALRGSGLGAGSVPLRIGMSRDELEQALASADYDFQELERPDVNYRFYPDLGLAVRIQKKQVTELVIVQISRRPMISRD